MYMQMKMDKMQLFLCEVGEGPVDQEQMEEAIKGEQQCHMKEQEEPEEVAWGDVHDCELDPVELMKARKAEMQYFTKIKGLQEGTTTTMPRHVRQGSRQGEVDRHQCTGRQEPQVQITTRGEGLQKMVRSRALHGHTSNIFPSSST